MSEAGIDLRLELQRSAVADEVSAVIAIVRPILNGTLFALKHERVDRFGGFEKITLADLAREYRAGDGDCGICFEYAVHDAVRRKDAMVLDPVYEVLTTYCKIDGDTPESILFGAEKAGSQQLIDTAKEMLTPESVLLSGYRGRPANLRRHIESAAREFRRRKIGTGESLLPQSISGLWKADLFLGKPESDKWVGTSVKINPDQLEGAKGLRVGIVPARTGGDAPRRDVKRNLIICPLPYDGSFMEVFYRGWVLVKAFLAADAKMPRPASLPLSPDRQVAQLLVERAKFPVLEVIAALNDLAQPELLETTEREAGVSLSGPHESPIETGAILVPQPKQG